jgi:N-acetylmuramoyl-L-alanine amidase
MRRIVVFWSLVIMTAGVFLSPKNGGTQDNGRLELSDKSKASLLTNVRHRSSKNYTRIVLDLSSEVKYEAHILEEDHSRGLPSRIYVDLSGARLAMDDARPIEIQDGLLRQVRVGQFGPDVVRVVLDMNSLSDYKTFVLPDPYRLVIDIQGQKGEERLVALKKGRSPYSWGKKGKLSNQGLRKIVLDPGHGGKDPGAIGVGGIAEKDIVLGIAKKLARKLRSEMGIEVVLTRDDDSFIPLEDRTAIANAENADLFISLHTNASPNPRVRGLETYYLDNTDDEASMRLAARENATPRRNVSDLQFILSDLTQNSKLEDSITLAHHLHSSLASLVGHKYGDVRDLGVKKALFYVLVGAKMPSVLAEIFFITNKTEGRRLRQSSYQNTVVDALYRGIKEYQEATLVAKNL